MSLEAQEGFERAYSPPGSSYDPDFHVPVLVKCLECKAVVLEDDQEGHRDWHATLAGHVHAFNATVTVPAHDHPHDHPHYHPEPCA